MFFNPIYPECYHSNMLHLLMRNLHSFFQTKSSKSGMYLMLTVHLNTEQPQFKCGYQLSY